VAGEVVQIVADILFISYISGGNSIGRVCSDEVAFLACAAGTQCRTLVRYGDESAWFVQVYGTHASLTQTEPALNLALILRGPLLCSARR
jgi:hypothetical protein